MAEEFEDGLHTEAPEGEIEAGVDADSQEDPGAAQDGEASNPGEDSDDLVELLIGETPEKLSKTELAELWQKSKSLDRDYTQKSQKHADDVRAWNAQVSQVNQGLAAELTEFKGWLEFYQANQAQAPDFAAMAREKGAAAAYQAELDWRGEQSKLEEAKAIYRQVQDREDARAQAKFQADVLREFPQWSDPVKLQTDVKTLQAAAQTYGFTQQEVLEMRDVRTLKALSDLARIQAIDARKPEIAAKVAEVSKQTPVRSPPASGASLDNQIKALERQHRAKPSFDTAAQLSALRRKRSG